jgi:hypothetical protein
MLMYPIPIAYIMIVDYSSRYVCGLKYNLVSDFFSVVNFYKHHLMIH